MIRAYLDLVRKLLNAAFEWWSEWERNIMDHRAKKEAAEQAKAKVVDAEFTETR